jgi:hypothetical protein
MAGVPTHPTAPHGRKQRPDQRSLDESPPFAIEHLRARTGRFAERSLLSGATAPPRSRPSPRTRELSSGYSSPHARAPHGPVAPRQQPVPGSCDSSLVSRASWPWMNRRRLDGDDRPNDQPHDVDAGERHERPKPPPRAELVPEEWLRRCLHPLCDHPTVLSLRHARSLPASAAAIVPQRPIARRKLVPPDRERAVPIPVELRCPPSRLDRASQRSPGRETAQLRCASRCTRCAELLPASAPTRPRDPATLLTQSEAESEIAAGPLRGRGRTSRTTGTARSTGSPAPCHPYPLARTPFVRRASPQRPIEQPALDAQ